MTGKSIKSLALQQLKEDPYMHWKISSLAWQSFKELGTEVSVKLHWKCSNCTKCSNEKAWHLCATHRAVRHSQGLPAIPAQVLHAQKWHAGLMCTGPRQVWPAVGASWGAAAGWGLHGGGLQPAGDHAGDWSWVGRWAGGTSPGWDKQAELLIYLIN